MIGFLLAAIAAPAVAFVAENLSRRFRSGEEIEASLGAPVLSAVPIVESAADRRLFNSRSPAEEAFRRLRTTLLLRSHDEVGGSGDGLTLLVTSAHPGEEVDGGQLTSAAPSRSPVAPLCSSTPTSVRRCCIASSASRTGSA